MLIRDKKNIHIALDRYFSSFVLRDIIEHYEKNREDLEPIMKAILFSYDKNVFESIQDFSTSLDVVGGDVFLQLHNVDPRIAFNDKLLKHKEIQITSAIRDIFFKSDHFDNPTEFIHGLVHNANLIGVEDEENNPIGRVMIQGGHNISEFEKRHHQELGFHMGLQGLEIITGSGGGAMKSPFKGALLAYGIHHIPNKKLIGLTEKSILRAEKANPYNNHFIVFPDIEKRMEAFLRLSKAGIILPGGVGTLEEILIYLSIKLEEKNKDFHYPLFFIEPKEISYFKDIFHLISEALDVDVFSLSDIHYYQSHLEMNREVGSLYDGVQKLCDELKKSKKKNMEHSKIKERLYSNVWNDNLYFPKILQTKMEPTQEFFNSISLEKNQSPQTILWNIRCLCSLVVEVTVRDLEWAKRNQPIKIRGDKNITSAFDTLIDRFLEEKRIANQVPKPYKFIN